MKKTTLTFSLFLALSLATLQAQNNSLVGVWHFPNVPTIVEFTETQLSGLFAFENEEISDEFFDYKIIDNQIWILYCPCEFCSFEHAFDFRLIDNDRFEILDPHETIGVIGYRMDTNQENRTVATGLYIPVDVDAYDAMTNIVEIFDDRRAKAVIDGAVLPMVRYRIIGNRLFIDGGWFIFEIEEELNMLRLVYPGSNTVLRWFRETAQIEISDTHDEGVVIGGVRWATRNVAASGTFAETPESTGKFFQWNRQRGWNVSELGTGDGWDNTFPDGTEWTAENDPCPPGWRVPTMEELNVLLDGNSRWTFRDGVAGRVFGVMPNQIFLPAAGWWNSEEGKFMKDSQWAEGLIGSYWSSTLRDESVEWGAGLSFFRTVKGGGASDRADALLVRCVAVE